MNKLEEARKSINEIDKEMAALFVKRMEAAKLISEYKMERGLPILDQSRENEVIARNSEFVADEILRSYYVNFLKDTMSISRKYQQMLQEGLKVAYSGVEGAFANIAAKNIFPSANMFLSEISPPHMKPLSAASVTAPFFLSKTATPAKFPR